MKKVIVLTTAFVLLMAFSQDSSAWDVPAPAGGGLRVYVKKKNYDVGERVRFMLYKHAGLTTHRPIWNAPTTRSKEGWEIEG